MQRNNKMYNQRKTDIQVARDKQKRAQYKKDLRKNKWLLMQAKTLSADRSANSSAVTLLAGV